MELNILKKYRLERTTDALLSHFNGGGRITEDVQAQHKLADDCFELAGLDPQGLSHDERYGYMKEIQQTPEWQATIGMGGRFEPRHQSIVERTLGRLGLLD